MQRREKNRRKWGTLLSMMDLSCNPRKKGEVERGNERWWEGMRRQMGSLHILAHTLKTQTSVLDSDLKLNIYGERHWERSLKWVKPTIKHIEHMPRSLHFIFQRVVRAIGQSMDLDFIEFVLICDEMGSEGRLVRVHSNNVLNIQFFCPCLTDQVFIKYLGELSP